MKLIVLLDAIGASQSDVKLLYSLRQTESELQLNYL